MNKPQFIGIGEIMNANILIFLIFFQLIGTVALSKELNLKSFSINDSGEVQKIGDDVNEFSIIKINQL